MNYTPTSKNCICKIANVKDLDKTKSGLYVISDEQVNTDIWEIVYLPDQLPETYKDLKVGDKFLAWKGWRGFKVDKLDDGTILYCIDLLDVAALVE